MRPHLATLVDDFRAHAQETAVVSHRGNRRYPTTYGELATLAGRFSAELGRRNIAPGERIVLWGASSPEWIAVFFGCLLRGVLAVPLDAAGDPGFAARVIRDTAPKLIVADPHLLASVAQPSTDNAHPAFCSLPLPTIADHLPVEPLFAVASEVTAETPFQIVFTSGTTSEPRGVVHTHRNILVTLDPIEREMAKYRRYERIFHPLRFLHSLPLSHVFGQFLGLWLPGLLTAEVHFAQELEPARLTGLIRRERISVLIAVPRVLHLLRAHLLARFPKLAGQVAAPGTGHGLPAVLRKWARFRRVHSALGWKFWAVISGGATLPADLEAFWDRLGLALIQGYGMTETAALVTLNHPFHIAHGTIGKALPGREVRISDDGEILVRGDMLSTATWSGGAMRPREGEWLATGDLAERSATGDLKFLGRKGDLIVTAAGLNIHPADLEAALVVQPAIRAAAVVPCDLPAGTEPVAVVLTTASDAELAAAVAAANRTLAEYQQIRRVLRWAGLQLPYTSTGKLIRRQVTAWAAAQLADLTTNSTLSSRSAAEGPASSTHSLLTLIASVTGEPTPATTDAGALRLSEDLHLDSLGRVQIQSALEQHLSLDLEDDAIASVTTLADLCALVEAAGSPSSIVSAQLSVERQQTAVVPQPPERGDDRSTANDRLTTHLYPRWPWSRPIQALRVAWIELVMRPLVWLLAAPRVTYAPGARLEAWTSTLEPVLIVSNHITAYDGAFILYALPPHLRRRVAAAMSGEMLLDYRRARNQGNWFLNSLGPAAYYLLTALFNVFPLPRARGFRRSFAHAGEAMDRGYSVLIFPEGTRSHTGGMNPFRPGIGLLAQQSRVPILPIALVGLYELITEPTTESGAPFVTAASSRVGSWFHSRRIEVRIGPLIPAPTDDTDPAALTAALEQTLRDLLSDQ